jgi:hypothetical protein
MLVRRLGQLLVCSVAVVTVLASGSAAMASDGPPSRNQKFLVSYVISDPRLTKSLDRLVKELESTGSLDRLGIKPATEATLQPLTAAETEQRAVQDGATYAAAAKPAVGGPGVLPQEKSYDYITPDECDANDQSSRPAGWIKNHFAYCQEHVIMQQAWSCWGPPELCLDGVFGAAVRIIGDGKTGVAPGTGSSRWVDFRLSVPQVIATGVFNNNDAKMKITLPCRGRYDDRNDGSPNNACHPGQHASGEKTIPQWRSAGDTELNLVSDAAPPDTVVSSHQQVARAAFRPEYHFTLPGYFQFYTPRGEEGGVRFDSAAYLGGIDPPNRLGSIFDRTVPSIAYSKTETADPNANASDVAYHIETALQHPEATYPPKDNKKLPGGSARDLTHRLYPGFSAQNDARYKANRDTSIAYCDGNERWAGYRDLGYSCDEYPYAATYEGAARYVYENNPQLEGLVSVKPVRLFVNTNAGRFLSAFYGDDRILERDGFFTRIVP